MTDQNNDKIDNINDLNLEVDPVQEPKKSFFQKWFGGVSGAYNDKSSGWLLKITITVAVFGFAASWFLRPGSEATEADFAVQVGKEVKTQVVKDEAKITEAQKERLLNEEQAAFDNAVKNNQTFVPNRIALRDSTKSSKQILREMSENGSSIREAKEKAAEVYRQALAQGKDKTQSLIEALSIVYGPAYDKERKGASTEYEARLNTALFTRDTAKEMGAKYGEYLLPISKVALNSGEITLKDEQKALETGVSAGFELGFYNDFDQFKKIDSAMKEGTYQAYKAGLSFMLSDEDANTEAAKAAYRAGIHRGMSEEEARKLASQAAYELAYRKAIESGLSEEEAKASAAKAAYKAAIASGASEEDAQRLAGEAAYEHAYQQAIANGMTEEEARAQAMAALAETVKQIAYQRAIEKGMSEEEARAFADQEAVNAAYEMAYKQAIEAGLSEEEAKRLAQEAAYKQAYENAIANGLSEEEAQAAAEKAVAQAAYQHAYKAAIKAGLSEEEAKALANKESVQAAYDMAYRKAIAAGLSEEEAKRLAQQAAYKQAYENAIANGLSEEEAKAAAEQALADVIYKEAYEAALKAGLSEEEAKKAALEALVEAGFDESIITQKAIEVDADLETLAEVISKAVYERELRAGATPEEAARRAMEATQAAVQALAESKGSSVAKREGMIAALKAGTELGLNGEQLKKYIEEKMTEMGASEADQERLIEELSEMLEAADVKNGEGANTEEVDDATASLDEEAKKHEQTMKRLISQMIAKELAAKENGEQPKKSGGILGGVTSVLNVTEVEEGEGTDGGTPNGSSPTDERTLAEQLQEVEDQRKGKPAVAAGTFMFGYTITSINTDVAATEVVGQVVGGPFDSARIIGSYSQPNKWGENVSLEFSRMNFKGEEVKGVKLIAFNTGNNLPAFVNDVDRHYLQRFGALFIKGLSAGVQASIAAKQTTTEETTDAGTESETKEGVSDSDANALIIAGIGEELASRADEYWARPITTKVYVGQEMKLLAMENIYMPTEPKNE